MTKILLTGSSGQIGGATFQYLSDLGYNVKPFDIKTGQNMLNLKHVDNIVKGMDIVVHLAAIPHPHKQFTGRDYFRTNVVGTFNMIEASVKHKVKRFIYSSSTAYYGLAKNLNEVKAPIGDEDTLNWVQVASANDKLIPCWLYYGSSKVASEALIAAYGDSKQIETAILRFAPCPPDKSKIAGIMQNWGAYVTIADASRSIQLAIDYEGELWYERFNISTEGTDCTKAKEILGY